MSTSPIKLGPYGVVTVDGQKYREIPQIFVQTATVTTPYQVITNQRLTLPGIANFLLKGLSRDFSPGGGGLGTDSAQRVFRFRLYQQEGTSWFFSGGLGVFDDRVFDNLCFGSGQFPFPLIPPVPVHANGTLIYEIEDPGVVPAPIGYPYTIHFGFHGAYLIPVDEG